MDGLWWVGKRVGLVQVGLVATFTVELTVELTAGFFARCRGLGLRPVPLMG